MPDGEHLADQPARALFLVLVSLLATLPAFALVVSAGGRAEVHVDWTLPSGQQVESLWNGNATYTGQDVMVHNADWNGSLSPGQSATFGYVVSGDGGDPATGLPCQVG